MESDSKNLIEGIYREMEESDWLTSIIAAFLRREPDEAADGAMLVQKIMEMRADEASGSPPSGDE